MSVSTTSPRCPSYKSKRAQTTRSSLCRRSPAGSPTTLPSLLLRTCYAPVSGISWVVKVPGTTSTPASTMLLIGPAHMTMYCGRWSAFVTTLVSPPLTSACSRARATAAQISKSATCACRADRFVGRRHRSPQFQRYRSQWADSIPAPQPRQPGPHPRERSCRQDPQLSRHISPQPACGFFAGVHVYLGTHPRRAIAFDFLHIQQTGRRLF